MRGLNCPLKTILQGVQKVVVRGLLLIPQEEHLPKADAETRWDHVEQLLRVTSKQALFQHVCELQVFEDFFVVRPGQPFVIQQVDEQIECGLYVIPARSIVSTARVERSKQEVTTKLVQLLLLDMLAVGLQVGCCNAIVDKVEQASVLVAD